VKSRLNPDLSILGLSFVIHDSRSALAREVIVKAQGEYPDLVCASIIGQNIKIEEAQVMRKSIFSYAPDDRGALQYDALSRELLARMEG
jgi:cellulose biosynthesis protein BcsQ